MSATLLSPVFKVRQFRGENCGLHSVNSFAVTELVMLVFRHAAMIAKLAHLRQQLVVIRSHGTRIAVGPKVLARIKTEASQIPNAAAALLAIFRSMRLGC